MNEKVDKKRKTMGTNSKNAMAAGGGRGVQTYWTKGGRVKKKSNAGKKKTNDTLPETLTKGRSGKKPGGEET